MKTTSKKKQQIELSEPILVRTLGLSKTFTENDELKSWFSAYEQLNEIEEAFLAKACNHLLTHVDYWNEEELKMHFISMIIFLADYQQPFQVFFDREISAEVDGVFIKTEADMLVSKGFGDIIETPYFFLHEYKREKKYTGDPIGQMLGGMLIAQAKNNNHQPVYGCYVQGRFWFFSILTAKEYIISQPLNATAIAEAAQIVYMLRYIKKIYS
jgi:hypothetical protein